MVEGEVAPASQNALARLLTEGKMAGALDQVLQEKIKRALLGLADLDLGAIDGGPLFFADVVVEARMWDGPYPRF